MKNSRRAFIARAATALAATAASPFLAESANAAFTSTQRGYVAGKYALELDGIMGGWLDSVDGGALSGPGGQAITITCGPDMSKSFYDWIKASFAGTSPRKDGAIITADYNYKEISRTTFFKAALTEVAFPALDAASKDAAKMSVKFGPESLKVDLSNKGKSISGGGVNAMVQKKWLPSNFRLTIGGLDCRYVNKIEAITWAGGRGSDLIVSVAASHAGDFVAWQKKPATKSGTLDYLEPNLATVFFSLGFGDLGIANVVPPSDPRVGIPRVKASMSYRNLTLTKTPA